MKYKPGDICWLKQKEHCIDIDLFPLPDGCYNHPVVVIWEEEEHEAAAVLVVSIINSLDVQRLSSIRLLPSTTPHWNSSMLAT